MRIARDDVLRVGTNRGFEKHVFRLVLLYYIYLRFGGYEFGEVLYGVSFFLHLSCARRMSRLVPLPDVPRSVTPVRLPVFRDAAHLVARLYAVKTFDSAPYG